MRLSRNCHCNINSSNTKYLPVGIAFLADKKYIRAMPKSNNHSSQWLFAVIGVYTTALILNAIGFAAWLPSCPIYDLTGLECLGCGINRAAILLLRGNVIEAYLSNPLIFLYILMFLGWVALRFNIIIINLNLKSHE